MSRVGDFTQLKPNRNWIVTRGDQPYDMDIDALHSTLLSIAIVSEKLRVARENLSFSGKDQGRLATLLSEIEADLRMAKATLGTELGFRLCPRCWPPELAMVGSGSQINCPRCGEIEHENAA